MSQRLIMTPSLQQAIKLLQMSQLELVDEIQQELTENPVLDEVTDEPVPPSERGETEPPPASADAPDAESKDPFDDIDYESYFQDVDASYVPRSPMETGDELPSFESSLTKPQNLADHLAWQLEMNANDERAKEIGRAIIGNLNEDGYLRASIEEIQQMGGWSVEEVEATLSKVQEFDFLDDDCRVETGWLRALCEGFGADGADVVTGQLLPSELETEAQRLFLHYSHMDRRGFQPRRFTRDHRESKHWPIDA